MIIGIDLGGTKILTAVADKNGRIISSVKVDTQAKLGPKRVIENVIRSTNLALVKAKVPLSKISRIGLGAPGPVINGSTIVSPPNLPGWHKVNIKQILGKILKKEVIVENDANAAALAEYRFGAGKGSKNMIYMTISTGIGGGIIIDGKLYKGSTGTAGEVGHMVIDPKGPRCGCGNYGCLEALSSGPAIARVAGTKDALEAEKEARKGDKRARNAIKLAAWYLGIGISDLVNLLNPDKVILGGGVSNMGDLLFKPVRQWVAKYSMDTPGKHVKIVPAKLKSNVGVIGAIAICLSR